MTVSLYTVSSGQHEQTAQLLAYGFTAATGIKVALRSACEDVAEQLLQERAASPVDVFYAENLPAIEAVRAKNLLAPADPDILSLVP